MVHGGGGVGLAMFYLLPCVFTEEQVCIWTEKRPPPVGLPPFCPKLSLVEDCLQCHLPLKDIGELPKRLVLCQDRTLVLARPFVQHWPRLSPGQIGLCPCFCVKV
jgi:hypothetical protein